jgi:hypothetical protein
MGKCNKSDYNHVLYNQNRARAKSGDKLKNVIDHVILLKKKEQAEGQTTRLKMAWLKANAKLKKFGITQVMIDAVIEKK